LPTTGAQTLPKHETVHRDWHRTPENAGAELSETHYQGIAYSPDRDNVVSPDDLKEAADKQKKFLNCLEGKAVA
jgi:hypothetical protein